jgi:hypothetical protein
MPTKKPETQSNPANPVRKVSFGAIARKKDSAKATHPTLPDPNGQLGTIAARIIQRHQEVEALSGALDLDKTELKTLATPFYFQHSQGKIEIPTGVVVQCEAGQVLVSFPNRYAKLETDEPLHPILGENTGKYFRQAFALEIDGDKLPAEHVEELLEELQALFAKYQAADALNVKESIKPLPEFHTARHSALNPAQNLALDQVCPIIAMVKAKGRK